MRILLLALTAACIALCAAGCEGVFEDDYLSVHAHDEQYTVDEGSDALTAENYLGLKNAILSFVENHTEYGVIRIYNYEGEVESDLADAAYEVAKSDPLGAYAVDYMTHDCTLIVSYYEIHIYITFARTQAEIDAVERVGSVAALRAAFETALLDGVESLTLRLTSYSEQDYTELARECYEANPRAFAELPNITVELYPSSGVQRILRFTFAYEMTASERASELAALGQSISALTAGISTALDENERFAALSERLLVQLAGAEVDENAIVYDTLRRGAVNSESLSKTLCLLAEEMELSCVMVSGRRNNVAYAWNIVTLDGESFHVDLLRDLMADSEFATCYSDSELETEYTWDRESVPVCDVQRELPPERAEESFSVPLTPVGEPVEENGETPGELDGESVIPAQEEPETEQPQPDGQEPPSEEPAPALPQGSEQTDDAKTGEE